MAKKVVTLTEFFDDFDGKKIDEGMAETIEFTIQGSTYRMDLRPENAAKFRNDLEKWVAAAEKVGRRHGRAKGLAAGSTEPRRSKDELTAIRQWAAQNGYEVSGRGRIAFDVIEAFEAAH
ncbi:Lsr2 family protein [Rhodococcus hoagii]|nr:Lsr2 family protein [Prescottella equi]NKS56490.1 Lsr2 family protein [Prescottella equi]NKS57000.1 Lsr2 family protein [Prescottella equi]NKS57007.1 Lsr2 family protein [Prescottella equi]NKS57013.1 Lsr2 family protein [Prescottella equi]